MFEIHGPTMNAFEVTNTTCVAGGTAAVDPTPVPGRIATFRTPDGREMFARKYSEAERCLLIGIENPVPLAQAHCNLYPERVPIYSRNFFGFKRIDHYEEKEGRPHVAFTDGITRTLWLLHNGARVFPVRCDLHTAQRMQECAGLPGGAYMTVDQLFLLKDERSPKLLGCYSAVSYWLP